MGEHNRSKSPCPNISAGELSTVLPHPLTPKNAASIRKKRITLLSLTGLDRGRSAVRETEHAPGIPGIRHPPHEPVILDGVRSTAVPDACSRQTQPRKRYDQKPGRASGWIAFEVSEDLLALAMLWIVSGFPILIIKRDRDSVGNSRGGDSGDNSKMRRRCRQNGTHNPAESLCTSPHAVVDGCNSPQIHPRRSCPDMDNSPGYPALPRCTYTLNRPVFHHSFHLSAELSTFCCGWWILRGAA